MQPPCPNFFTSVVRPEVVKNSSLEGGPKWTRVHYIHTTLVHTHSGQFFIGQNESEVSSIRGANKIKNFNHKKYHGFPLSIHTIMLFFVYSHTFKWCLFNLKTFLNFKNSLKTQFFVLSYRGKCMKITGNQFVFNVSEVTHT